MRLIYSALHYAVMPLVLLRLLLRSVRQPGYRHGMAQRFGFSPASTDDRPVVWVHAVSVGEVSAAVPVVDHLLCEYGQYRLLVTTSTPTGAEVLARRFGARVEHCYAPWDLPGAVRRFLQRVQPRLVLVMETELWPNWLYRCERSSVPVMLVNGRLSARSAARYQRGGKRVQNMVAEMVGRLDHVACQSAADATRFQLLGVGKQALTITGSTKMAASLEQEALTIGLALRSALAAPDRVVVAACSTQEAELPAVLEAFGTLRASAANAVLILAPRRIESADVTAGRCRLAGHRVALRSLGELPGDEGGVLLVDTIGELGGLCGAAQSAFVGGSLVPHGGQNPIEAARWGLPVLCGPHTDNFAQVVELLAQAHGLATVTDGQSLGDWWLKLARDETLAARMGDAAKRVVEHNGGALEKLAPLLAARL